MCILPFLHWIILLHSPHCSLILIQCVRTSLFLSFAGLSIFNMSFAFFIKPSISWETKHLMSKYTCTRILITCLASDILLFLPIVFHLFTNGEVNGTPLQTNSICFVCDNEAKQSLKFWVMFLARGNLFYDSSSGYL